MSEYRILIRTCLQLHVHEYLDSILSQHICQSNVDHIRISSNFPGEMKHSKATPTRLCLAQHLRIDPLHFGTTHWDLVDFTPSNNMAGLGVSQLQLYRINRGEDVPIMFQCHVRKAGSTVCPVCVSAHPVPYMQWISCHSKSPNKPSHLKVFHKAKSQALHLHGSSQSSHDVLKNMLDIWKWSRKFGVQSFVMLFLDL